METRRLCMNSNDIPGNSFNPRIKKNQEGATSHHSPQAWHKQVMYICPFWQLLFPVMTHKILTFKSWQPAKHMTRFISLESTSVLHQITSSQSMYTAVISVLMNCPSKLKKATVVKSPCVGVCDKGEMVPALLCEGVHCWWAFNFCYHVDPQEASG